MVIGFINCNILYEKREVLKYLHVQCILKNVISENREIHHLALQYMLALCQTPTIETRVCLEMSIMTNLQQLITYNFVIINKSFAK